MSLETVLKLSGEWHEAVARDLSGPQCRFPPPWFPAQSIEDYELVPIDNAVALYLEGKTMHHCVASRSYVEAARMGWLCICSIRTPGKRVATIGLGYRSLQAFIFPTGELLRLQSRASPQHRVCRRRPGRSRAAVGRFHSVFE
jgi:hypothetical protein